MDDFETRKPRAIGMIRRFRRYRRLNQRKNLRNLRNLWIKEEKQNGKV